MKPFSSKQYFYLSLLLACRKIESNSTPELKDRLCQYHSAGFCRLARGGRPFCILIKAVRKKMWLWTLFTGASSVPLNRQAPVLQENGEDLFIFKARSFSCAGGGCWGRLRGQNADVSWLLQLVLQVHSLHPQAPHHCRLLFISSSFGLVSPWRSHEGYDRSQLVAVIELCIFEPSENIFKAFKRLFFFLLKLNVYSLNSLLGFNWQISLKFIWALLWVYFPREQKTDVINAWTWDLTWRLLF